MRKLNLEKIQNSKITLLGFGIQRRVCVALSLIGDNRVIFTFFQFQKYYLILLI